jgi:hypothetical protein
VEVRCITCGGSGTQLCPECKGSFRTVRFSFLGLQLYRGCKVCAVRSTFPSGVTKCSSCLGSQKQSIKCTGCRGKGLISCSMCSNGQCPECKGIPEHCAKSLQELSRSIIGESTEESPDAFLNIDGEIPVRVRGGMADEIQPPISYKIMREYDSTTNALGVFDLPQTGQKCVERQGRKVVDYIAVITVRNLL